jgi:hypothetical protein
MTFAVILVLGQSLLPKLTPNSVIAVGLAGRRALAHSNTFRFIVFTCIISGILLPLLLELAKIYL